MIPMRLSSDVLNRVTYLTGSAEIADRLPDVATLSPFCDTIVDFLNDVSREIIRDPRSKAFSDVVTFGFWIRKASVLKLKERFEEKDDCFRLGKGVVFHIAPSNVPVNFAYSLVSGLICGNANIVRVPSKDFPQVSILCDAFKKVLVEKPEMKPYILCVRYERDKEINDLFSSIADMRVVWGGDQTIAELRKSPLPPRSGEITFADRYSLAVIDSEAYLTTENKDKIAEDFYNDTFFSDQNACTSPRIVIWTGKRIDEAKKEFWKREHQLVAKKYQFQSIQCVNKLTSSYLVSVAIQDCRIEPHEDNLIIRVKVPYLTDSLMDYKDNSGFFFEYDCKNIMEMKELCNNKRCQTLSYLGDSKTFIPLLKVGIKGIDRVVPIGKTMDFDLIWDGYNLSEFLSRIVVLE